MVIFVIAMFLFVSLCSCLFRCVPVCFDVFLFVSMCSCLLRCVPVCFAVFLFVSLCSCLFRRVLFRIGFASSFTDTPYKQWIPFEMRLATCRPKHIRQDIYVLWWRLFQKRVVCTKFDIYVLLILFKLLDNFVLLVIQLQDY